MLSVGHCLLCDTLSPGLQDTRLPPFLPCLAGCSSACSSRLPSSWPSTQTSVCCTHTHSGDRQPSCTLIFGLCRRFPGVPGTLTSLSPFREKEELQCPSPKIWCPGEKMYFINICPWLITIPKLELSVWVTLVDRNEAC